MLFGNRLEVRSVAVQQPLHALFNIQNIRHADHQMSARCQHPGKLANCLVRIFNVLEAFQAGDELKFAVAVRQHAGKVPATHFDLRYPENVGIQVAGPHIEARLREPRRKCSFACRHIQQFPAWKRIQNARDRLVNFQSRNRYGRALRMRRGALLFLLCGTLRWSCVHHCGR